MKKTLCVLAMTAAWPAHAGTFGPYDDLYVFGDSLSDSGNLADFAPSFAPDPPYFMGQFSNGDTWATLLGLQASAKGGTNYAWGGARSGDNGDFIPDLTAQTASLAGAAVTGNSLAVIWAGGNDFRDLPDDVDSAGVAAFIGDLANNIATSTQNLYGAGFRNFTIFGLPDFGTLPRFNGDPLGSGQATFVSGLLNTAIDDTVSALNLGLPGADVGFFDLDAVLNEVLALVPDDNKSVAFLDDAADCVLTGCTVDPGDYLFYDDIHPTAWVHERLADAFRNQVLTPVPLPASATLLLAGLGGLAVWGRRRKSLA